MSIEIEDIQLTNLDSISPLDPFDVDTILTNQFAEVLVNQFGNVLVTSD